MTAIPSEFDIGSLIWVKAEIDQALVQAGQCLQSYAENPSETKQLRFAATHLHQVTGAIQMVSLDGLAKFSEEMEASVLGLEKGEFVYNAEAHAQLQSALQGLNVYLGDLVNGQPDVTLRLYPLFAALRQLRGLPARESELFFPTLNVSLPAFLQQAAPEPMGDMSGYFKTQRSRFQLGLLQWLRDQNVAGLQAMYHVLRSVSRVQPHGMQRAFWWACTGLVESLAHHSLVADANVRQLFSRLDLQLRRLAEGSNKVAERLFRDVLYLIAISRDVSENVVSIKQTYSLYDYLPGAHQLIGGSESERIKQEVAELRAKLQSIQDAWVKFSSGNHERIKVFSKELAALGHYIRPAAAAELNQMIDVLQDVANQVSHHDLQEEAASIEVATTLLLLENSLNIYPQWSDEFRNQAEAMSTRLRHLLLGDLDSAPDVPPLPALDEASRKSQERMLLGQVVNEIKSNLHQIETVLDKFFRDQGERSELEGLLPIIHQIRGALDLVDWQKAIELLEACGREVERCAKEDAIISLQELEFLAEALSSIEFYMEAMQLGKPDADAIIEPLLQRAKTMRLDANSILEATLAEPVEEAAPEEPHYESIETEIGRQKSEAQQLLDSLEQNPEDEAVKAKLKATLHSLQQNADLVADPELEAQSASALTLLDQKHEDAADLKEAVASLSGQAAKKDEAQAPRPPALTDEAADAELLEIYLEEAQEVLSTVAENSATLEDNPHDFEALTTIRRAFHTLKGSGRMVGLMHLGDVAWNAEQLMNKWLQEERSATPALLSTLKLATSQFLTWVEQLQSLGHAEVEASHLNACVERLRDDPSASFDALADEALADESHAPAVVEADVVEPAAPTLEIEAETAVPALAATEIELEPLPTLDLPTEPELGEAGLETAAVLGAEPFGLETEEISLDAYAVEESAEAEPTELRLDLHGAAVFAAPAAVQFAAEPVALNVESAPAEAEPELVFDIDLGDSDLAEASAAAAEPADFAASSPEDLAQAATLASEEVSLEEEIAEVESGDVVIAGVHISPVLYDIFIEEAQRYCQVLAEFADAVQADPTTPMESRFVHAAHTMRGIANTTGFRDLGALAEGIESCVAELMHHARPLAEADVDLFAAAVARVRACVAAIEVRTYPEDSHDALIQALHAFVTSQTSAMDVLEDDVLSLEEDDADETALAEAALVSSATDLMDEEDGPVFVLDDETTPAQLVEAEPLLEDDEQAKADQPALVEEPVLTEADEPSTLASLEDAVETDTMVIDLTEFAAVAEPSAAEQETDSLPALLPQDEPEQSAVALEVAPIAAEDLSLLAAEQAQVEHDAVAVLAEASPESAWVEPVLLSASEPEMDSEAAAPAMDTAPLTASDLAVPDLALESEHLDAVPQALEHPLDESALLLTEAEPSADDHAVAANIPNAAELGIVDVLVHSVPNTSVLEAAKPSVGGYIAPEITVKDDIDEQLLEIFVEEAQELLPQINGQVRSWRADPDSNAYSAELKRLLHTLKGSARMAGAMRMGEAAHNMESHLIHALDHNQLGLSLIDDIEQELDRINDFFDQLTGVKPVDVVPQAQPSSIESIRQEVVTPTTTSVAEQVAAPAAVGMTLGADAEAGKAMVRVRADMVDRLVNQAGEVSISRSRIESEMIGLKRSLFDLTENVSRLRAQLREIEIQAESQMQSRMTQVHEVNEFDPLEFDRFTRLQELTRFMAESVNDVATIQHNLLGNLDETSAALAQQARMTKDLQQELMRIRMVPFSSISERLYRIVRQTGKEVGKKVNLEIRGGRVEIDRSVLEKMTSPFEHMLRNAIDHGLETRETRLQHQKPEVGEVVVDVRQEGNELVMAIRDDGAGLNLDRIRAKGLEKGLITADQQVSDYELMQLIFAPGFSTAQAVTQISGRGIGMDVVKNEITTLGGRVEVSSEFGRGTTFTIHLPLTLAVTQVVLVQVAGKTYAIPAVMVAQVQEVKTEPLNKLYQEREVRWQNDSYPFVYLPHLLGDSEATYEVKRYNTLLLVRSGQKRLALHVDQLNRNQEVVVKNIGPQLASVPGVVGATVLGNGEIVLIINPIQLQHFHETHSRSSVELAPKLPQTPVAPAAEPVAAPSVMVVDDSLTVRKITGRLLAREGYQVLTAKDGVDALQQLKDVHPDVMLLDIEMPRMDGFELTRNIRNDSRTRDIPIIMITSRTAEKHRSVAMDLGVNVFLGKPYQEDELLGHIASFVQRPVN